MARLHLMSRTRLQITLVLWLLGCLTTLVVSANEAATELRVATAENDTVTIDVAVDAAQPLAALALDLYYDPQVIRPISCVGMDEIGCNLWFEADGTGQDRLRVNFASVNALVGQQSLLTLDFDCVADGVSPLTVAVERLVDVDASPIPHAVVNSVYACNPAMAVQVAHLSTQTAGFESVRFVSLALVTVLLFLYRSSLNRYGLCLLLVILPVMGVGMLGGHVERVSAETLSTESLGDVNCDGAFDVVDALFAKQFDADLRNGADACHASTRSLHQYACDVNLDQACDRQDAAWLLACDLGHENEFCTPGRLPDRYIVTFSHVTPDSYTDVVSDTIVTAGGQVVQQYQHAINGLGAHVRPTELADLLADPYVVAITPDHTIYAEPQVSSTSVTPLWHLDRLDQRDLPLDGSYAAVGTGEGVHVYVIDSGIRPTHEQFAGRVITGASMIEDPSTDDCTGHGTHVAGTIGGNTVGVANAVTLVPVRVLGCGGGNLAAVVAGVDWVVANHVAPAVINMSLGTSLSAEALQDAVRTAVEAGITVVAAAGNSATDACRRVPAQVPEVITVGAMDNSDARASFSNKGSCIDLFAPGKEITSASHVDDSSTVAWEGTSMAAPHVAGAVALYLASNPTATPEEVTDGLLADASVDKLTNLNDAVTPNLLLYIPENLQLPTSFRGNPVSDLFFDQNGERINFEVCADSMVGRTVFVQLSTQSQTFDMVSQVSAERCLTFWNLNGEDAIERDTPYFVRAAINQHPNPDWPIPCHDATDGDGMCDRALSSSAGPTVFSSDALSNLYFDQGGTRINLEICANNAVGQTLHVQLSTEDRTWPVVTQVAAERCTTFFDLDGPGSVTFHKLYTTRAALNQDPNPNWPGDGCAMNSGWQGLCDQRSYP